MNFQPSKLYPTLTKTQLKHKSLTKKCFSTKEVVNHSLNSSLSNQSNSLSLSLKPLLFEEIGATHSNPHSHTHTCKINTLTLAGEDQIKFVIFYIQISTLVLNESLFYLSNPSTYVYYKQALTSLTI